MGKLTFLVKMARAGGSTWATQWRKDNPGGVVVSGDQIRLALHGKRYVHRMESMVNQIYTTMIRTLLLSGYSVLADDTHTSVFSLEQMFGIDIDANYHIIDTPLEICKQRAIDSGQIDLVDCGVIDRHFKNMVALAEYGLGEKYYSMGKVLAADVAVGVEKIRSEIVKETAAKIQAGAGKDLYSTMIQNIPVSTDLMREKIVELGRESPMYYTHEEIQNMKATKKIKDEEYIAHKAKINTALDRLKQNAMSDEEIEELLK